MVIVGVLVKKSTSRLSDRMRSHPRMMSYAFLDGFGVSSILNECLMLRLGAKFGELKHGWCGKYLLLSSKRLFLRNLTQLSSGAWSAKVTCKQSIGGSCVDEGAEIFESSGRERVWDGNGNLRHVVCVCLCVFSCLSSLKYTLSVSLLSFSLSLLLFGSSC